MKGFDYGDDDASSRAIFASKATAALLRLAKGLGTWSEISRCYWLKMTMYICTY